ncbi:hypothetical protein PsYK624_144850 [Phanerochaete sordida]|uniref:Uncharacterized protein n=1 Tax=Phanerochaete sordida TaxID=48140 RepID=A0A9P3LL30_9APHY|nr:hypothetical protein PsYK624_144850 [Phanerochaete sordida]
MPSRRHRHASAPFWADAASRRPTPVDDTLVAGHIRELLLHGLAANRHSARGDGVSALPAGLDFVQGAQLCPSAPAFGHGVLHSGTAFATPRILGSPRNGLSAGVPSGLLGRRYRPRRSWLWSMNVRLPENEDIDIIPCSNSKCSGWLLSASVVCPNVGLSSAFFTRPLVSPAHNSSWSLSLPLSPDRASKFLLRPHDPTFLANQPANNPPRDVIQAAVLAAATAERNSLATAD